MRPAPIEVRDEDGVRWIRLRRPEKANALDAAMMQAVAGAVDGAHAGATELVALCGEGDRGFCAGADIAEFAQGVERLRAQEHALVSMIDALSRTPIPVCALVHGRALGAGGILLTLADLAIAADDLSFGFPEIRFGMYPVIVHASLRYRLTAATAAQLCLSGRLLGAHETVSLGLVTQVVPRQGFDAHCRKWLAFYRERAAALAIAKRAWATEGRGELLRARVRELAPLMIENFGQPGVRDRIAAALNRNDGAS